MTTVRLRCHAELNDFLSKAQRHTTLRVPCVGYESIKNLIESVGVPHPELAALLVDAASVDFSYVMQPGESIDAYPISCLPSVPLIPLRPPLSKFEFVLDTHMGRLAAYLRMLGFDTLYRNDFDDPELAQLAHDEGRILLTRDIGLLKRSLVIHGYFVRETAPERQLSEVIQRFQLHDAIASFQRCIRCNGLTQPVDKASIEHLLKPKTRQFYDVFQQCQVCGQVYWRGSHYARMQELVERALQQARRSKPRQ